MAKSDKQRALEAFLESNKKKYGDSGAKSASAIVIADTDVISTGSMLLDDALGIGGLPKGRVIELYGEEGSGKTSLGVTVLGNCQVQYPEDHVGIIDVEHALNLKYAEKLGIQRDRLVLSQPSSGEQALDEMLEMASSGAFSAIMLDSVGGLSTRRQLEKEVGEDTIGEVARLMSNNVKKITDAAARTKTLVIFINQIRTNIGAYGAPPTTMGGKALKFFSSVRINVKGKEPLVDQVTKDPIGQNQIYIIKKNRMGVPFKEVETEFFFGRGFNKFKEVIDIAIDKGIIDKGGAWFYPTPGDKTFKFQGKDNLIQYFASNEKAFNGLVKRVKAFVEDGVIEEITDNVEKIDD